MKKVRKLGGVTISTSQGGEDISARVTGLLISFSGVITFLISNWLGYPIVSADIVKIAELAGVAVGAVWALYGALRALVIRFSTVVEE